MVSAGSLCTHGQEWNRPTGERYMTQRDHRTEGQNHRDEDGVRRPSVETVGLSGRVQELWVLVKEARCKWVLKRPSLRCPDGGK